MTKKIRIGIFGTGRGMDIAKNMILAGGEIVAICDFHKDRCEAAAKTLDKSVAVYDDFDVFLEHPMDAVVLANFFPEHAPYAIKCMEKNLHVFSECISNSTMAEGVALARAFEKSSSIYMLAENYPNMLFNREIKRLCDSGTLGKILYAEGEYNHPGDPMDIAFLKRFVYSFEHWRNYTPATYYITHSLGPVMCATGATPKTVSAVSISGSKEGPYPVSAQHSDYAAIITTQNDDGSVFRVTGCAAFGAHHNSYRVCGTKGQIENVRGMGDKVMLRYNEWERPEGASAESLYAPQWNDKDEALIKQAGHGGSDYLTARNFLNCIRENRQPEHPFHLHAAIAMASVAILGHRSALEGGKPFAIPDFTKESDRLLYENDHLTPYLGKNGEQPTIPCSPHPYSPTEEQKQLFRKLVMGEE